MEHAARNTKQKTNRKNHEHINMLRAPCCVFRDCRGFTIMEVIVATSIFAVTITLMLTLFNYTLRIQRRTEALRQVAQTVRNVGEFLTKEIRNGQIDYNIQDGQIILPPVDGSGTVCPPAATLSGANAGRTYNPTGNQQVTNRIGIINLEGERECIGYDSANKKIVIIKENVGSEELSSPTIEITMLKFYVRPSKDPYTVGNDGFVGVQPMVTIMLKARVQLPTGEVREIPYQTSVSTNIYNIPNET